MEIYKVLDPYIGLKYPSLSNVGWIDIFDRNMASRAIL